MGHLLDRANASVLSRPGTLTLRPPPRLEARAGSGLLMNALPLLGSLGSIAMVASMSASGGGRGRGLLAGGLLLFATLGFVAVQIGNQRQLRHRQVSGPRTAYLDYLVGVRATVRGAADDQRRTLTWHHPAPGNLAALAEERSRVWERTSADPVFLHVRYGLTEQPLGLELVGPVDEAFDADPAATSALHRLIDVHRTQPDLPVALDLRAHSLVDICGTSEQTRALARALICSGATFHAPGHLNVAVLTVEEHLAHWDWLKWLPHAHSERRTDAVGARRMVATTATDLADLLPSEAAPDTPHLMLIVDGFDQPAEDCRVAFEGLRGVTVINVGSRTGDAPDAGRLRWQLGEVAPDSKAQIAMTTILPGRESVPGSADQCPTAAAEALARRLLPLGTGSASVGAQATGEVDPRGGDFISLLGLGDLRCFDPESAWESPTERDRLRIPIGSGQDGAVVHLDLKEAAEQGMGPHGLCIGATGSGKSEFLRTLVLGLALTHSPERLNLVLVDFKGGATFAGMSEMPHVSAVITNLANELTLVDRMQDALAGEMVRRQELLRAAGNFASARDYEAARSAGADLAPMPSLFIVVDEFSELLSAKPEFIDLFVAIGRVGRSLGLHLLLASQRLEEGRLRGLESHLSYRIGLRTFSAQESRAVLGVPDAYELPAVPGLGYLKLDPTSMIAFTTAYVSGALPTRSGAHRPPATSVPGLLPFTISEVIDLHRPRDPGAELPAGAGQGRETLLDAAVARVVGRGAAAHQVWLPPLNDPDTLDRLMDDLVEDPRLGLVSPSWRAQGDLSVPIGTLDRPREQRRDTLSVHLAGASGHVGVIGGPRSGKSTLLRTIVTGTALITTPAESQFFVLDFGGGTFSPLAALPHVAGVATRSEPDVVRRIVAEISGIVDRREAYFRTQGIDSIETYRARRREGLADDGYGDVFLVVDGWGTLRSDFEEIETHLQQLGGRGLTNGFHLVTAASRWSDFRAAMRDQLGTRLELRLGDPMDSEIDRRLAADVPNERGGRGLTVDGLHFLGALPRVDGRAGAGDLAHGVADLIDRVATAWRGPSGPKLRMLPEMVELSRVRQLARRGVGPGDQPANRLLLGIDESDLTPVSLDVDDEPHLMVFGDGRSGKSSILRCYLQEVMRTRTPKEAQIVVVDYRRSLLGEVAADHQLHYLTSSQQAEPALRDLADYLHTRLPGPDVTPEQLRRRSWWSGAEVFVVVDDYDLAVTQRGSPVAQLQPLLAQAPDVGLHLVLARRTGGASRALHEPVIQSLRDLATPGLMLSGNPDEGPLLGGLRPRIQPSGRGQLITRDRGIATVQTAWTEAVR